MKVIHYFFSSASTWSYVGSARLAEIAAQRGARVEHYPVNLKRVFSQAGGRFLAEKSPAQRHYREIEMKRWREIRNLTLTLEPRYWPVSPKLADLTVIAAQLLTCDPGPLSRAIMHALWVEDRDISARQTLMDVAHSVGLDGETLLTHASSPQAAARYLQNTEEAVRRQMVGAPMYYLDDEPFWGQDRLELLELALLARGRE